MKKRRKRKFPDGTMVRICHFYCCDPGSVPGGGNEIPTTSQCRQQQQKKNAKKGLVDNVKCYKKSSKFRTGNFLID